MQPVEQARLSEAGGGSVLAVARHYTPKELATAWHVHENTIRRLFADEPGVLKLGNKRRGCREYFTLRIPEDVVARVYQERCK